MIRRSMALGLQSWASQIPAGGVHLYNC